MAWTVEDCAILLQAMAGHDPADPASVDRPIANFSSALSQVAKGLRIGVVRHAFERDVPVSLATLAGINTAIDVFRSEGADVQDVCLSPMADYHAVGWLIMLVEAFTLHAPWLRARFSEYGEIFRDRLATAALISGADVTQAQRRRRMLCREMAVVMHDLDILILASASGEAPHIADVRKWAPMEQPGFTMPFNITGYPAMSICTGFGAGELPVAMQLVGKPFAEPTVFRAAHAYERAMDWRKHRPKPV